MKKVVWILIFLVGCIEPYMPPEIKPADAILVIEGHININGKSMITLSRSQNLYENGETEKVNGAVVFLENEKGVTYPLTDEGYGQYALPPQALESVNHRLVVKTNNTKEYVSEFVAVKNSPPLDSVSWELTDELGIAISTSTHGTETATGYYRWKYEETWVYTSPLLSLFVYDDVRKQIDYRNDDIFHCWRTQSSKDIFIASSTRLSENRISQFPLITIEQRDPRLRYVYSVLVTQYSITEEAFNYWNELKKTTEDLGTLFSPMPSQVSGNFTCLSNPDEKVLGYFSIGTRSEKRIFIDSGNLPAPGSYDIPPENCFLRRLELYEVATFNSSAYLIADAISVGATIVAYNYTTIPCADCRTAGGTNVKPDFWP